MAVDGYMYFQQYPRFSPKYLISESTVDFGKNNEPFLTQFGFKAANDAKGLFEIEEFNFDIEQTLSIGSQSTGAGAGKVTFNPFSITRKIDRSSPVFYENACSGTPYQQVTLGLRKSSGAGTAGQIYLVFNFKLVAAKTVSWQYDDEAPKETITFEYGGLQVFYNMQKPDGSMSTESNAQTKGGWNRVKNIVDQGPTAIGA